MIKIIFSDMDGTLLDDHSRLPDGFDQIMLELKARKVIFAPASGRQFFSLITTFDKYQDDFMFVAENGTNVVYRGKEIFSMPMFHDDAAAVLDFGAQWDDIFAVFCGKRSAYYLSSKADPNLMLEFEKYFTKNTAVESFADVDDAPLKISFFDVTGHVADKVYPMLHEKFKGAKVELSSDQWVDVMAANVSKGMAIRNVQRLFDLQPDECAAFGDYLNDAEMMQAVGYGFAMANAHPDLKKLARYETTDNNHAGVLVGIRRLMDEGLI